MVDVLGISGLIVAITALAVPFAKLFFRHVVMRSECAINDDAADTHHRGAKEKHPRHKHGASLP